MWLTKNKLFTKLLILLVLILALLTSSTLAAEERIFDIQIKERHVEGDNKLIRVTVGDELVLNWRSDETVAVHLHGYDIEQHIDAGVAAEMKFTAHATGRFPVTSHGFEGEHGNGHQALVYLEVHPE